MSDSQEIQTLDETISEMEQDVQRFKTFWLKNHEISPEYYPLKMGGGDWYDQFQIFITTDV